MISSKLRKRERNRSTRDPQTIVTRNSFLHWDVYSMRWSAQRKRRNSKPNTANTEVAGLSSSSFWPTWNTVLALSFWTVSELVSSMKWESKSRNIRNRSLEPKIWTSKTLEKRKSLILSTPLNLVMSISKETLVRLFSVCTKRINLP